MSLPRGLEIIDGHRAGDWIGAELSGPAGSVGAEVPNRYEAYVRILHPAHDSTGRRVTWAQVAEELGRTAHPLAQWDAIVGANRYRNERPEWPGSEPETGSLDEELLAPLLEMLAEHTIAAEKSFFGVWVGMSWGRVYAAPADSSQPPPENEFHSTDDLSFAFPAEQVALPRLVLPGREYVVLAGRLEEAILVEDWLSPSSPNLIWPEDRAWFVASEIDFDSTLVGGPATLARSIVEDPRLEAFPVEPRDLLTWDADKVNPPLPP